MNLINKIESVNERFVNLLLFENIFEKSPNLDDSLNSLSYCIIYLNVTQNLIMSGVSKCHAVVKYYGSLVRMFYLQQIL